MNTFFTEHLRVTAFEAGFEFCYQLLVKLSRARQKRNKKDIILRQFYFVLKLFKLLKI